MKAITVGPGDFVHSPFVKCPYCGQDTYGILMICGRHYLRRCKSCFHPYGTEKHDIYPLPELRKKVIYVDQLGISNMMKALNPSIRASSQERLNKFWLQAFEKLHKLCKLQLILCPASTSHLEESLVSPFFEPLREMYELLSYGTNFIDHESIVRSQIVNNAKAWLLGEKHSKLKPNAQLVLTGRLDEWQRRFIISVNFYFPKDWIDELRKLRSRRHDGLSLIFSRWQREKHKTFYDFFDEEYKAFGITIIRVCLAYFERIKSYTYDLFPPNQVIIFRSIHDLFQRCGVSEFELTEKIYQYLTSDAIKNIPSVKISTMLWAAIARKAAAGQKKPPDRGMANDIEMISTLLPYCDAMFIDKTCHSYLREEPLCSQINHDTRLFSLTNTHEFLEYLTGIEASASFTHMAVVNEIYGEDYSRPFTELYDTT